MQRSTPTVLLHHTTKSMLFRSRHARHLWMVLLVFPLVERAYWATALAPSNRDGMHSVLLSNTACS